MTPSLFEPYQRLADVLLAHVHPELGDGAHDLAHIQRVWRNVRAIQAKEGGDLELLLAATVLHDCVAVEKNAPLRSQASRLSAEKASSLLAAMGWPLPRVEQVGHAIHAHSFSAAVEPLSLEARILQDADRLDAIGMIGVARCFHVSGRIGSALYDHHNPHALGRDYQDRRFAIEHFQTKLLALGAGFRTEEGARLAAIRHQRLQDFYTAFMDEVAGAEAPR